MQNLKDLRMIASRGILQSGDEYMIHLRKMRPAEFLDYVAFFVPDFAAEISRNYDVDLEAAEAKARATIEGDLAQGVETPGQVLLCVVVDGDANDTPVGYLWYSPVDTDHTAFISDFFIQPAFRGKGYGRLALSALEALVLAEGRREIRLRVAADNAGAHRLYLASGFRDTGINMKKDVG